MKKGALQPGVEMGTTRRKIEHRARRRRRHLERSSREAKSLFYISWLGFPSLPTLVLAGRSSEWMLGRTPPAREEEREEGEGQIGVLHGESVRKEKQTHPAR